VKNSKKRYRVIGKKGIEGIYWAISEEDAIKQYEEEFGVVEKNKVKVVLV